MPETVTTTRTTESPASRAPEMAFSHVGLYVTDQERMAAFYTRVLGFTITDRGPVGDTSLVFLSRDPREHHQIVLASGRPADTPFNVVNQISFRVAGLADVRAMHARLAGEPVSDVQCVSHGNAMSVYFRDPEGNRIEVFCDTPWYVTQPVRIPFDFSRSDEELMRWAEDAARRLPGFTPAAEREREMARRMGRA
ncbi:MAG: VOC family protein [Candidatus Rokubacteria bacterium]|nr:VOC family protein [Candidatus Rokubacteria bacterium]MBI3827248.1 VOC family protein [Candidatus Rokubacteria bacterium]